MTTSFATSSYTILSLVDNDGTQRGTIYLALPPGSSGNVLASHGAGVAPTFIAIPIAYDAAGNVILSGIPTSDPAVAGAVYSSSGTLKISAG